MTRRRIVTEHPRANLSLPPQTITVENRGGESRIRSLGDGRAGARLFTVVLIAGLTLLGGITAVATLGYSVGPIHSTSAHIGENARSVAPASAETALTHSQFSYPSDMGWQNITKAGGPPGRYATAFVYDAADGYLVLYGGYSYTPGHFSTLYDTWTLANGTWTNVTATAGAPPVYMTDRYPRMTYDAHDGYVVMMGGDAYANFSAWKFSAGAWSPLAAPPVTNLSNPVYDSTDGYVIATSYGPDCSTTRAAATYSYSGGTWTNLNTTRPCLSDPVYTDDPAAGGVLEWGGLLSVSGGWTASNQTWLFSHGVWTNLTSTASATMPWGDSYDSPGLVYDPAVSAAVLIGFSGNEFDTWAFNGTWANESTPSHPPALAYTAVGWDPEINGIRMFGGLSSASTNATWEYSNRLDFQAFPPIASPATVDQGFATTLSAQFQGGTGPWNVSWTLGDGSTAYGADVSHAYATQGAFTVTSVVKDSLGSTLSAATVVTVVSAVSVVASSSLPVTDLGLDPLFTAVASGGTGIATATWDFGDGTVALGASVYHSYHAVGRYSAVVWVNDTGAGSVSALVVTQVNTAPSVNFTFSPSAPVLGELVNFTAAPTGGTPPYALSWAFGDGGTGGNLTAISHVFTTNGPFSAAVTVTDHVGGRATFSSNLTVALNLSIFGSWAAGAAPLPVGFTSLVAGGIPGYTYAWAFGDGATSTEAYPSHTYALPGQYTAQLTVTDAAQHTATAHWALAVFTGGGPLAVTVTAGPSAIAVGGSTALQASPSGGTGGYRLAWLNGPLSCVASGVLSERCTGPAAGSYVVTLQVYDSTGAEQAGSVTIQVGTPSIVSTPPPAHPIGLTTGQWLLIAGAVTTASVVALAVLVARRGRAGGAPPPPSLGRSEGGQPQSGDGRDTEEDTLSDLV